MVYLLYGCGLRVTEPLELRVNRVDVEAGQIVIRAAKGNEDRIVALPECRKDAVAAQLGVARALARSDAGAGLPVALPGLLAAKVPKAKFDQGWAWVFPAVKATTHSRSGEQVRWRMHEVTVRRAVRKAAEKAGMSVTATPHVLRHTFATHAHHAGAAARALQAVLGHTKLETTMGYLDARPTNVRSPPDML